MIKERGKFLFIKTSEIKRNYWAHNLILLQQFILITAPELDFSVIL